MKKVIGSKATCNHIIPQLGISGTHCEITKISENTYLLIDLDSSNGTYVNDRRIRRTIVTPNDKVILAKGEYAYLLKINDVFSVLIPKREVPKRPQAQAHKREALELYNEFAELELVWNAYQESIKKIQKQDKFKRAGIFLTVGLVPFIGSALAIGLSGFLTNPEKMQALRDEFKMNWICPNTKCKRYFPVTDSWEIVREKHTECPVCKAKYKRD
jgi:hypothetical protein